jgi:hypothetical protein
MATGERHAAHEAYKAWMLRLWQVESEAGPVWHGSLQRVGTEERRGFDDVEDLLAHLREHVTERGAPRGKEGDEV